MALDPISGLEELGVGLERILEKAIPDTAAKDAAKAQLTTLFIQTAAASDASQAKINEIEAGSTSLFVSGWRPCLGWTCDLIFIEHYLVAPLFKFIGSCWHGECSEPKFDIAEINSVLWALLAMGAYRTVDKGVGMIMKAIKS